jgi:hypothetical protein
VRDEGCAALDTGIADVTDLFAVESFPLLLMEALGERNDVDRLWGGISVRIEIQGNTAGNVRREIRGS